MRILLALLLVITSVTSAISATIQWTNTAGGLWNVAQNWSPNVVPTAPDTAIITNDGVYTVTLTTSPTLSTLTLGGQGGTQTLSSLAAVLTVTNGMTVGPSGHFSMGGGTLIASGGMILQGSMTWSNGVIGNTTVLTIASNATLIMPGSSTKTLSGTIHNRGAMILSGTGSISAPQGTLNNNPGGLFELQTQAGFNGPSSRLVNDGIVRKTGGPVSLVMATQFTNNSLFEAQSGMMNLTGLTLGEGSTYIGPGTNRLIVGATANGNFTSENLVLDADLTGNGILHGAMVWSNGICSTLTVASNGLLTLAGNASKTVNVGITNLGSIHWRGAGLSMGAVGTGAVLHNRAGALLDAQHTGNANMVGGLVINDGVVRKSSGSGVSSLGFARQNGVLDAQTGTISLGGSPGGASTIIGDGSSFIGSGTNALGGNVTLLGSVYSENLVGGGGGIGFNVELQGNGTLHGFTVFLANLATAAGSSLSVASNATLSVRSTFLTAGFLTNAGTITLSNAVLLQNLSTWHNLANGLINLKGNPSFIASGSPRLINEGTFWKSSGSATSTISEGLIFTNNGAIIGQSGTLMFSNTLYNPAGTLALAGGKISSAIPLFIPGGRVVGSGTLQSPAITSGAAIEPGATNAVLLLSGSYTQLLSGSIQFNLGGTTSGVNHSKVIVEGNAHVDGLIGVRFSPGYSPEAGDTFSVLDVSSLTGRFVCFDGFLLLGENRRLIATYSPTHLTLNAIAAPDPDGPTLGIAGDGALSVVCWPAEFNEYYLYTKTNLNVGNWLPVSGSTNRYFETTVGSGKYFRLISE